MRRLLAAGADPDAMSRSVSAWEDAYAPLHLAARRGHRQAVKALLTKGAAVDTKSGDWRTTPLLLAMMEEKFEVASDLPAKLPERTLTSRRATAIATAGPPRTSSRSRCLRGLPPKSSHAPT